MNREPILVVEDEFETAELLKVHLHGAGYDVRTVRTGAAAAETVKHCPFSMVIVNAMLTDIDGLELCRKLRSAPTTRDIPLVILSAREEEDEVVDALDMGVEDYIVKPFKPRVLLARLRSILRRRRGGLASDAGAAESCPLFIDARRHSAMLNGKPLALTLTQFRILQYLAAQPGIVRTRSDIVSAVHGNNTVLSDRAIDVHVAALRQKMGEHGRLIETVRGVGYRLTEDRTVWVSHEESATAAASQSGPGGGEVGTRGSRRESEFVNA